MNLTTVIETLGGLDQVWPDAPSVRARLGRNWSVSERLAWRELVHKCYGRQALRAGQAIFGRDLRLTELGQLSSFAADYLRRVQESPSLAPALASFVKVGAAAPADYKCIREDALKLGLEPGAWRWLSHQAGSVTRKLLFFGWTQEAIFWTNLLSKALGPRRLCEGWLEAGRVYGLGPLYSAWAMQPQKDAALALERLLRLLPLTPSPERLAQLETLGSAMLRGLTPARNSSWEGLLERVRRQEQARLRQAERELSTKLEQTVQHRWPACFGRYETQGVIFDELTSNRDLVREGVQMSHCVGEGAYLEGCLSGKHLVARVSSAQARATVQLRRTAGNRWMIAQLAGVRNARVPQHLWQAAQALQAHLASKHLT